MLPTEEYPPDTASFLKVALICKPMGVLNACFSIHLCFID